MTTMDLHYDSFTSDCRNVIDGRAFRSWPGILVIADRNCRMNIRYLEPDHPDHLWHILKGADHAAVVQPMMVDTLPALFLVTAPKHPDPAVKHSYFWVRHMDGAWEEIRSLEAPWLMASTAGAMRTFLCTGRRSPVKYAADPRLFGTVFDEPPPVDRHGRI